MYAPVVTRFDTHAVPVEPATRAYMDAVMGHKAFREWHAGAMAEKTMGPVWNLDRSDPV
jgi:glutathione S-transferase